MRNNKRVCGNEEGFYLNLLLRGQNHTLLQGSLTISQRNQDWARGKVEEL